VQILVLLSVLLLIVVTGGETVTMQFWRMDSTCVLIGVCFFFPNRGTVFLPSERHSEQIISYLVRLGGLALRR
jgi:hypothetical protein